VSEREPLPVDEPGLTRTFIGDGRPLLYVVAVSLLFSGGFALFLSAGRQLLPHDVAFLRMTPDELCELAGCRVVDFMIHDRVAWGGTLIGVGLLYLWLTAYPLSRGEPWAWWGIVVSGAVGFASFLGYLSYGYLDTWHGVGSLLLLPIFVMGLAKARSLLPEFRGLATLLRPGTPVALGDWAGWGRALMLFASASMVVGGLTILTVGVTSVFVPQDLEFMRISRAALDAVNPRIVPLLAHDRVGFGGGVAATASAALICIWCARPSRTLWQILALSWFAVTTCAVGIHYVVGYRDLLHLAPAEIGAAIFLGGLIVSARPMLRWRPSAPPSPLPDP
jgi:hypothetical protein